jgi:putative ABC transport system permease protein
MIALFAVTALLLAALGIYGVISYIVAERTHEIGVRVALGARRPEVIAMILRRGMTFALPGAALGLITALLSGRWLSGVLYDVGATDPATLVGVTLLLLIVALIACWLPARRAAGVAPMVALREE